MDASTFIKPINAGNNTKLLGKALNMNERIKYLHWGCVAGAQVYLFMLRNNSGAYVTVTNFGATLVKVAVPDRDGNMGDVILGFPDQQGYLDDTCYIGSTIGRYANRVSNARFELNGTVHQLDANDGPNSNHSGSAGFNRKVFGFEIKDDELILVLHSPDGEGGYPGNLNLRVSYRFDDNNQLSIRYHAVADADTYANFTNHAYFNLSGSGDILGHQLSISAGNIVGADKHYIPTGQIIPADEIAFDDDTVGQKVAPERKQGDGINSFYILDKELVAKNGFAAKLSDAVSGRTLTVDTSYPGIFMYTGDYLSSARPGHGGEAHKPFEGLCLECQHYPDAMNRPEFPSALLPKHQVYNEFINFKFGLMSSLNIQ